MRADIIITLGDEALETLLQSDLLARLIAADRQIVAITSDRGRIARLRPLATRYPLHIQIANLEKYDALTSTGWNVPALTTAAQRRLLYEETWRYFAGGDTGAVSRAEAAARMIFDREVEEAVRRALSLKVGRPHPADERLTIGIALVDTTYRSTGSGGLTGAVARIGRAGAAFRRDADIQLDVILGTQSVYHAGAEGQRAGIGRRAALAELALAEALGVEVGPELTIAPGLITHVLEVGAPGLQQGLLEDDEQGRRALALALDAYLLGATAEAIESRRPYSTEHVATTDPATGARRRFSGMNAVEVRLEPAAARVYLLAWLRANLPAPA